MLTCVWPRSSLRSFIIILVRLWLEGRILPRPASGSTDFSKFSFKLLNALEQRVKALFNGLSPTSFAVDVFLAHLRFASLLGDALRLLAAPPRF